MAKSPGKKKTPEEKVEMPPPPPPPTPEAAAPQNSYQLTDASAFGRNMTRVAAQSQLLLSEFLKRQTERFGQQPLDPLNLAGAYFSLLKHMAANPGHVFTSQIALWRDYLNLMQRTGERALGRTVEPFAVPAAGDRRFRDKDWQENQIYDFIKQSYLVTANWLQKTVAGVQGMEEKEQARASFYAKQFVDAIAPSNFVLTNPEVLRETLRTNGENLVKGLDNLLSDLERGQGELSIRQTTDNFVVGRDVATTPGKVVFRNELFELLQYSPTTEKAYEIPLLIFPPWINKFYILDLQPKNSFVKWAVERGYTVFVVSWVNPDPSLAERDFEDYMRTGIFAALDAVQKATGQRQVNAIGYCIAGTLLAATLAYIAASGEYQDRIKSATFLAAQVDFSQAGDLLVFVDDEQLAAMEQQMRAAGGVLEGSKMAMTFNMLRANDLIWSFVVNNYLLGKEPVPFDLLYWNSDTTRMPLKLHLAYLRQCYRDNALAKAQMILAGEKLNIAKIKTPAFFQAAREDHIAPAGSVYKGAKLFGGPVTYMLAGSGHIAGVINPPAAGKYQHWTNDGLPATLKEWQDGAVEHPGSWWSEWDAWLAPRSGEKIPAPKPGDGELKPLADAPGTYVLVKAGTMNKSKKPGER
ncbi:MAG TPA: class I poly(R)-hydroxyalkanoic acid synthase [Micropepsaceae bacterium]|nr:class I poly(R)-hydroxyalkanoic acid synthase [Micropepsaceae bacterium]